MGFAKLNYVRDSVVIRDDTHQKRWVDAFGSSVVKYLDDFVTGPGIDTAFDNFWTVTRVEAGAGESTVVRTDGSGGFLLITTDDAEDDGINMQLIGESFELTTDQLLYFGAFGVQVSDATQSDLFLGLAITDTDILGGVTDRIGFEKLDGSTSLKCMVEKNSTETLSSSILTVAAATTFDAEFFWDGVNQTVEFFINGASAATPAITNLPNDEQLRLTLQFLAGAAAAKTCQIDAIRVIQIGR